MIVINDLNEIYHDIHFIHDRLFGAITALINPSNLLQHEAIEIVTHTLLYYY